MSHVPVTTHLAFHAPWSPDHSPLPWLWWLLVTTASSASHSGLVKSLVTNPRRKHPSHEPVTCLLVIRWTLYTYTVNFQEPFLLEFFLSDARIILTVFAELASCEPSAGHWPCLHVTGEKLGYEDYWDPESGECRPKNVVSERVFRILTPPCPLGDHWPWEGPCHTPDLSWCDIPHTHQTQWFCNWLCILLSKRKYTNEIFCFILN